MLPRFVSLRSCWVLLIASSAACSSGSPKAAAGSGWPAGASLPQPPRDIPEPVRNQLTALAKDIASALCERAASCCASLDIAQNASCVQYGAMAWSNAMFAKTYVPPGSILEYSFDEARAATCRAHLQELQTGCGFESARSTPPDIPALLVLQSYCAAPLSAFVTGQPAKQCFSPFDCIAYAEGLTCQAGACVAKGNAGDPCEGVTTLSGTLDPCAVGLHCVENTCQADLELGQACSSSSGPACAAGLTCKNDVCAHQLGQDEACTLASDCAEDLSCSSNTQDEPSDAGASTGVCLAVGPRGEKPCTEAWQCTHECVSGFCDPRETPFCVSPY